MDPEKVQKNKEYNTKRMSKEIMDNDREFLYVPTIDLYVGKRIHLHDNTWQEAHEWINFNGWKMLTIPEFTGFLKYLKNSDDQEHLELFDYITKRDHPQGDEWLDARIKPTNKWWEINYDHSFNEQGQLVPKHTETIDKDTLLEKRISMIQREELNISLDDWLANPTRQGLPRKTTKKGDLSYSFVDYHLQGRVPYFGFNGQEFSLYLTANPDNNNRGRGVRAAVDLKQYQDQ